MMSHSQWQLADGAEPAVKAARAAEVHCGGRQRRGPRAHAAQTRVERAAVH